MTHTLRSTRRNFLRQSLFAAGALTLLPSVAMSASEPVRIQRLNWAGIRLVAGKTTMLIDPIKTDIWGGSSPYPLVELDVPEGRTYALITHTHGDHFDTPGLQFLLGERGRVICSTDEAAYIASQGLKVIPVEPYHIAQRGPFTVVPLPAIDGLGDSQVSWLVDVGGRRYLHAGDTLWHGAWRQWGAVYGPFDTVFLPINGARQADDPPSEIPISLTPEQAVDAAILVRAQRLVPIHYGYSDPGSYDEYPDALNVLKQVAERRNVKVDIVTPGDWLD